MVLQHGHRGEGLQEFVALGSRAVVNADDSFNIYRCHQCCGTGTVGTVTFCLEEPEP